MNIDFTTPMTFYELLAIILAALALIIPLGKWIYDKYIKKLKISFLPSGNIGIYFNKSGAYISLGGVYEAQNKDAAIKNISAKVIRQSDKAVLSQTWSTFSSPIYRNVAGNIESSFEMAHPFKVEANTLSPVFIEFSNAEQNANDVIESILKPLYQKANQDLNTPTFSMPSYDAIYRSSTEYKDALIEMNDQFFWKHGAYRIELITQYNNSSFSCFSDFNLSKKDSEKLRTNIEQLFVEPLAKKVNCTITINSIKKEFKLNPPSNKAKKIKN